MFCISFDTGSSRLDISTGEIIKGDSPDMLCQTGFLPVVFSVTEIDSYFAIKGPPCFLQAEVII